MTIRTGRSGHSAGRTGQWVGLAMAALVSIGATAHAAGNSTKGAANNAKNAKPAAAGTTKAATKGSAAPKATAEAKTKAKAKTTFRRLHTSVARPASVRVRRVSQGNRRFTIRIRTRDVYLGDYRRFRTAGEIDTQKVFEAITHYRSIKSEGIRKRSGRYWILMRKANQVFREALRQVARDANIDVIAGKRAIESPGSPPADVTAHVIAAIHAIEGTQTPKR